jgi:hypothetical protein
MTTGSLTAVVAVPLVGVWICAAPARAGRGPRGGRCISTVTSVNGGW